MQIYLLMQQTPSLLLFLWDLIASTLALLAGYLGAEDGIVGPGTNVWGCSFMRGGVFEGGRWLRPPLPVAAALIPAESLD